MKKLIIAFILGGIVFGSIGIYATTLYKATDIFYEPSDASWEVSNVNDAINSLYENAASNNGAMSAKKYSNTGKTSQTTTFEETVTSSKKMMIILQTISSNATGESSAVSVTVNGEEQTLIDLGASAPIYDSKYVILSLKENDVVVATAKRNKGTYESTKSAYIIVIE